MQAVFQYGTGREKGTEEQRGEGRGGGRKEDRDAERLPLISKTYFLHYKVQIRMVLRCFL